MPTENHNFTYDPNADSVTVTARLIDGSGQQVDIQSITVPVDTPSQPLTLNEPFRDRFGRDTDRMVIDAGFCFGRNVAFLNISGTGTPGDIIECENNTTGTWNEIATVQADGTWQSGDEAAKVTVNPDYDLSGEWYKVRVRARSDLSTVVESTNTFLPGFVFAFVSQSEPAQMVEAYKDRWTDDEIPIQNEHNLQMLSYRDGVNPSESGPNGPWDGPENDPNTQWSVDEERGYPTRIYIQPNRNADGDIIGYDDGVTGYIRQMSNRLDEVIPNIPALFVVMMWGGTSRELSLMESPIPATLPFPRDFRFQKNPVELCRDNGTEIGVFTEMWYASDLSVKFDYRHSPLYTKVLIDVGFPDLATRGNTSDYNFGDTYFTNLFPNGSVDTRPSSERQCFNCFFDATTGVADNELGDGILRKDRSKYNILSTNTFITQGGPIGFRGNLTNSIFVNGSSDDFTPNALDFFVCPERTNANSSQWFKEVQGLTNDSQELTSYGEVNFDELPSTGTTQRIASRGARTSFLRLLGYDFIKGFMTPYGLDPSIVCIGEWGFNKGDSDEDGIADTFWDTTHTVGNVGRFTDGAHPIYNDQQRAYDGVMRLMEYMLMESLKTAGKVDYPIPMFSLVEVGEGGQHIILEVEDYHGNGIPEGASVENLRSVRGEDQLTEMVLNEPLPEAEHQTYKEVMGFELMRAGGNDPWDARYTGFDCDFDRSVNNLRVKITPTDPFQTGDIIRFNYGGSNNGHAKFNTDIANAIYKSAPILHIPGLPILEGIPVAAWPRTQEIVLGDIPDAPAVLDFTVDEVDYLIQDTDAFEFDSEEQSFIGRWNPAGDTKCYQFKAVVTNNGDADTNFIYDWEVTPSGFNQSPDDLDYDIIQNPNGDDESEILIRVNDVNTNYASNNFGASLQFRVKVFVTGTTGSETEMKEKSYISSINIVAAGAITDDCPVSNFPSGFRTFSLIQPVPSGSEFGDFIHRVALIGPSFIQVGISGPNRFLYLKGSIAALEEFRRRTEGCRLRIVHDGDVIFNNTIASGDLGNFGSSLNAIRWPLPNDSDWVDLEGVGIPSGDSVTITLSDCTPNYNTDICP